MIRINDRLAIDKSELKFDFIRAGGPGGQKVDRTASAVQLRFNVEDSKSLPEQVRKRVRHIAGSRINAEGELVITARRHRSQTRNREDAIERLVGILRKAAKRPRSRKKTKPSRAAVEHRLEEKRQQAEKKRRRKPPEWGH